MKTSKANSIYFKTDQNNKLRLFLKLFKPVIRYCFCSVLPAPFPRKAEEWICQIAMAQKN